MLEKRIRENEIRKQATRDLWSAIQTSDIAKARDALARKAVIDLAWVYPDIQFELNEVPLNLLNEVIKLGNLEMIELIAKYKVVSTRLSDLSMYISASLRDPDRFEIFKLLVSLDSTDLCSNLVLSRGHTLIRVRLYLKY